MSIEMDNPQTVIEKIDAASNLIEQMVIAHMVKDEQRFRSAHTRASELLLDALNEMEEES